jgi:hypothetical protein
LHILRLTGESEDVKHVFLPAQHWAGGGVLAVKEFAAAVFRALQMGERNLFVANTGHYEAC